MINYDFVLEIDSPELRTAAYRELGKIDLYFLARYILNYDLETETDIHYRFCQIADEDRLRQMMIMFRGSFKTSLGLAKVVQWLIRDPSAQIGIGSDTHERATKRVKSLKLMLETNTLLQDLYPELFFRNPKTESTLWTNDAFDINRPTDSLVGFTGPSVSAFGLDPLPTGAHFSKGLIDDIENEDNTGTADQVQALNIRVSSLIPLLNPDTPLLLLGTIYGPGGPNSLWQAAWPTYKVPIIDKNGDPTFPTRFPLRVVEQYKSSINDPYVWAGQYLVKAAQRTDKFLFPFSTVNLQTFEEFLH